MAAGNIYSPQPGDKLIPGGVAITEFFGFTGDCIEAAGEILSSWGQGKAPSGDHINRVVAALQQAGQAGPQGTTSLQAESLQLGREGVPSQVTGDWLSAVNRYAGVKPVELGVTRAFNLPGDLGHVLNHGITVEGRTAGGDFIISDPNSAAAKRGQLNIVTAAQLSAAQPWGAIVPTQASGAIGGGPSGTTAQTTGAGFPNPLDLAGAIAGLPGQIVSGVGDALKPVVARVGLFVLALVAIAVGALLIFWEPISAGVSEGTKAAGAAAVAA